jgi:8-oxo-dGTP pyrophosphatase MutT (NUDIX family)
MIELPDGVYTASSYSIRRVPGEWAYARANKAEIERHWAKRASENPNYFNGRVHIMTAASLSEERLMGTVVEIDFADTLYWRETGFGDKLSVDCFGDAILVGNDGSLVYGRQASGGANSGFTYPPGGFLDPRDIDGDGTVDLDRSIYRELAEETGYRPSPGERKPGYIISRDGPFLSVGIVFELPCSGDEFCEMVSPHLAASAEQELAAMVVLKDASDIARHNISPYAKRIAMAVLGDRS